MRGAMVILVAMIVIGIILYAIDVIYYRKRSQQTLPETKDADAGDVPTAEADASTVEDGGICCGMHTVCEKTNLSPITGEVVYYDDEELDRYRGREADSYTPEEIEEFRDVLLTLLPEDVAGWSRSIQVREINLPTEVRDELLMIVSELRQTT